MITKKTLSRRPNHRPGSRKGIVHRVFDEQGPDQAKRKAKRLKLSPSTISSWLVEFRRQQPKQGRRRTV